MKRWQIEERWRELDERGECTCVIRALWLGLDPDDPIPIDPDCEHHAHLLSGHGYLSEEERHGGTTQAN